MIDAKEVQKLYPLRSTREQTAIIKALELGEVWGYGNMIDVLKRAWADYLTSKYSKHGEMLHCPDVVLLDRPEMDNESLPTGETAVAIALWRSCDPFGWFSFISQAWNDTGDFKEERLETSIKYHLQTGGWSGNETLIRAMYANKALWERTYYSHRIGGHYTFRVKTEGAQSC